MPLNRIVTTSDALLTCVVTVIDFLVLRRYVNLTRNKRGESRVVIIKDIKASFKWAKS
jgi:hypothetical protein